MGAIAWTPPFNDVPVAVAIAPVPTLVSRDEQALLTGWTAPGAHCTLMAVPTWEDAPLEPHPTYADAYGTDFWLWSVGPNVPPGPVTVEVS